MSYLSNEEKSIAKDLLTSGYHKAAKSFATITKQKISIRPTHIEVTNDDLKLLQNLKNDQELILITTAIIGQHTGKSYLLFNEMEASAVYQACMPYNAEKATRVMETEALLKELDNILSAAVITEFSNYMNSMIFGDVPLLSRTNQLALKNRITEDFTSDNGEPEYFMLADTQFVFEDNSNLKPQFIWKLTEGFMQGLKGDKQHKKVAR